VHVNISIKTSNPAPQSTRLEFAFSVRVARGGRGVNAFNQPVAFRRERSVSHVNPGHERPSSIAGAITSRPRLRVLDGQSERHRPSYAKIGHLSNRGFV